MRLDGVTVLDFTHLLPGPYATQLLADMGAEVIKVESLDGEGARHLSLGGERGSLFSVVNRGKRSVALDLKADGADEVVERLVADADVVVEQFRPGVAERLGIDHDTVVEYNPEVVYCSISGYGQDGPDHDRVGHDLNYVARTGLLDMTRASDDERPVIPGVPVADMAGGLFATTCILSSLLARELGTRAGEYVDVSMSDVSFSLAQVLAAESFFGDPPEPGRTLLTGGYPCYGIYETRDGGYLTLAAIEEHFWQRLCEALDRPELADRQMADDEDVRRAVRETLEAEFATATADEWDARLGEAGVPVAPVTAFADAVDDPQLRHRGMVMEDGETPRLGFPARTSNSTAASVDPPPALGEHTEGVLARLGFGEQALARLRDAGVVDSAGTSSRDER